MLTKAIIIALTISGASAGLRAQEVNPPLVASSNGLQMSAVFIDDESAQVTFEIPDDGPDRLLLPFGLDASASTASFQVYFVGASLAHYLELRDDSLVIGEGGLIQQRKLHELLKGQTLQVAIPFVKIDDDGAHVLRFSSLGLKVIQWRLVPANDNVDAETRPYVTRSEAIVPADLYRGRMTCLIGD